MDYHAELTNTRRLYLQQAPIEVVIASLPSNWTILDCQCRLVNALTCEYQRRGGDAAARGVHCTTLPEDTIIASDVVYDPTVIVASPCGYYRGTVE